MNADAQQRPEPQIRLELTRLLFKAMPTSVWGTLLGILFCTIILWPTVGSYQLAAWTCIFLSWTVLRTWHTRRFESSKFSERETSTPWLAQFSVGALGAALCWAATSIWLFPIHQPVYQVVLAFMLITTCAVAITSLSPNRPLATTFLCIVLLPLIVRFSIHSSEIHLLMGLMSGFALILLIVSVQRINATTVENVALRLQAQQSEQDISASQQKLTLHRRSNPLAVIEWDTEFKITDWNRAAEQMFGFAREQAIGRNGLDLLVPDDQREDVEDVWQLLLQNVGGERSTSQHVTQSGERILCEWFNTTLVDDKGDVIGVTSLCQDVTERIRMEQIKNDFISVVSHELRTPLTSIRGSLGLVMGTMAEQMPTQAKHLVNIAKNNTERLLLLVNDILDVEKIENGKMEYQFESLSLMQLLAKAHEENQGYAQQYGVRLVVEQPLQDEYIRADYQRIIQVLNNLISNAIKFSPKHGIVKIDAKNNESSVCIRVIDRGIGIPADKHNEIFEKFIQLASPNTRDTGGTGLGLSIAKAIVEGHGGTIGFDSEPGQGSVFYFELPVVEFEQISGRSQDLYAAG